MKRVSGLLSLVAVAALLFLSLRTLERHLPAPEAATEVLPRYELVNSEWIRTGTDGTPQFIARAAQMSWFEDQSAQLKQADLYALGGSGSPWRLTAPEGRLPPKSRDLLLSGTVLATGHWPDGSRLGFHTDHLWVNTAEHRLHTDAEVSLEGTGRNVTAAGLSANFSGSEIQLLGKVRAQYDARPQTPRPTPPGSAAHAPDL